MLFPLVHILNETVVLYDPLQIVIGGPQQGQIAQIAQNGPYLIFGHILYAAHSHPSRPEDGL